MRKLLDFLVNKRHWFLFLLLEIISLTLIYRNHAYQRNIMCSSANILTGHLVTASGYVTSYLNLRAINRELLDRNGQLEMQVLELQDQLEILRADTVQFAGYASDSTVESFPYRFIMADVVNNSVTHLSNYITLNKGRMDGVEPDMGVVSERGVVGVVSTVSDHFSVVIPLLNPKFKLSCKVVGSSYFGTLSWNGHNARVANLDELPRHVEFEKGDTIVTSGYSAIFPAGIIVGHVIAFERQHDDNFYSLEVELATDFHSLNNVRIIKNYRQLEQKQIEQEAKKMINNILRGFIYFVVLVFIQVLVLNNIHFLRMATPFLYIYFILKMPVGMSQMNVLFFSFLMGWMIDMFSNTPGMHAFASTLIGFIRFPLIQLLMGKELPEGIDPSYKPFGYGGFFRYTLLCVVVHHVSLFLIESLTLFDPLFLLIRIVASVLTTVLLICTIEAFNIESRKSGD